MHLPALSDRELIQHAWAQLDELTSTALERRLIERFEAVIDEHDANSEAIALLGEHDLTDPKALRAAIDKAAAIDERVAGIALLDVLREFDIDDPEVLKTALQRYEQLLEVLESLAQPMADLQALATP